MPVESTERRASTSSGRERVAARLAEFEETFENVGKKKPL